MSFYFVLWWSVVQTGLQLTMQSRPIAILPLLSLQSVGITDMHHYYQHYFVLFFFLFLFLWYLFISLLIYLFICLGMWVCHGILVWSSIAVIRHWQKQFRRRGLAWLKIHHRGKSRQELNRFYGGDMEGAVDWLILRGLLGLLSCLGCNHPQWVPFHPVWWKQTLVCSSLFPGSHLPKPAYIERAWRSDGDSSGPFRHSTV